MKKRILVFVPFRVEGPQKASRLDVQNRIRLFVELGYSVGVIEFLNDDESSSKIPANFGDVVLFSCKKDSEKSFAVFYRRHGLDTARVFKEISQIVMEFNPGVLWYEYEKFAYLARALKQKFPKKKTYFRSHNYERGHYVEKWYYNYLHDRSAVSYKQLGRSFVGFTLIERTMFSVADNVFVISRLDAKKYARRFSSKKIVYLPFTGHFANILPKKKPRGLPLNVVFLNSNLRNNVNRSGLKKICSFARFLDPSHYRFYVTGTGLPMNFTVPNSVHMTGYVENIDDFLSQMDIGIVPIDIGYGMKVKAYEFFARGLPCIVSPRVHEVFAGEDGVHYLVAYQPSSWIAGLNYLRESRHRSSLNVEIQSFMAKSFSSQKVIEILRKYLK